MFTKEFIEKQKKLMDVYSTEGLFENPNVDYSFEIDILNESYPKALDEIERLQARVAELEAERMRLIVAFRNLYEACLAADIEGELSDRINGEILDAALQALKVVLNAVTNSKLDYKEHLRNMPENEYRILHEGRWDSDERKIMTDLTPDTNSTNDKTITINDFHKATTNFGDVMDIDEYREMLANRKKKPAKYRNVKTVIDDITFDSMKEAKRYQELKVLQRADAIKEIHVHKKFSIDVDGLHVCNYFADFYYFDKSQRKWITEDVKSGPTKTAVYRLKKKLMLAVHGIEIVEI